MRIAAASCCAASAHVAILAASWSTFAALPTRISSSGVVASMSHCFARERRVQNERGDTIVAIETDQNKSRLGTKPGSNGVAQRRYATRAYIGKGDPISS